MTYFFKLKKSFEFQTSELKQIFVSSILFGFILSFRKWGVESFEAATGINNWIFASASVFIVMFTHISIQKLYAAKEGYVIHYSWWFQGILIGLFISFLSFGFIPFLYPGTLRFGHIKTLRLGKFRHGTNIKDLAFSSLAGVLANIFLALIFGVIYLRSGNLWILYFIKINFIYAFFSLLPLPKISGLRFEGGTTAGFNIFFFSRPLYMFIFSTLFAYSAIVFWAITILGSLMVLIISLFIGLVATYFFLKVVEGSF